MNCRKVNQLLSAYMDGELRGVEQRQIFDHVARCADCNDEYESLLEMKRMLGCMRVQHPTAVLQARIDHALSWEEAQQEGRSPRAVWMRLRVQASELFASPQGLALGAIGILGLFAIVPHLQASPGVTGPGIAWQRTLNSVTELTAGLTAPSSERFSRPDGDQSSAEGSRFSPVTLRTYAPARPTQGSYQVDVFQPH